MHNAVIHINSKQLITNLTIIRKQTNQAKLCLPVKANAYGHGLVAVSQIVEPFVDYIAVACVDEGVKLRQNGITKPILVFGAFSEMQITDLINYNLEITLSSLFKARLLIDYCIKMQKNALVHIKVDTGMNRIGVRPENAKKLIDFVLEHKCIKLVGVYSHFASSNQAGDLFTMEQINKFKEITTYVKSQDHNIICHIANSGGVCNFPESYFDMVRPGIMVYGYLPNILPSNSPFNQIRPCFNLKSRIVYFKTVAKGQGISYDHKYITTEQTRVVTIPIGYGDGYRRSLSNIGEVIIHGHKYTISGTICMDMFMVDIGPHGHCNIDDEVVLIGTQGDQEITLESIANKCNTITYEILCDFNDRIPRIYY